jgi:hypothetical protein
VAGVALGVPADAEAGVPAGGDVAALVAGKVVWPSLGPVLLGVPFAEHPDMAAVASRAKPTAIPLLFMIARILPPA